MLQHFYIISCISATLFLTGFLHYAVPSHVGLHGASVVRMAWSGWSSSEWAGAKWAGWKNNVWSMECKDQWSWASQPDADENKQDESWTWKEAQTASNHTEMTEEQVKHTWVWRKPASRLWTHIMLHIDKTHKEFELVPRLIGREGVHMKTIA